MKKKNSKLSEIFDVEPFLLDPKNHIVLEKGIQFPNLISPTEGILSLSYTVLVLYFLHLLFDAVQNADYPTIIGFVLLVVFTCIPMCFLLTAVILRLYRRWRWKKAILLPGTIYQTDGFITHGKVDKEGELIEVAHFNLIVGYEFRSPSGIQLFGENQAARDDHELPKPGTPVAVLYLNHEEFKML